MQPRHFLFNVPVNLTSGVSDDTIGCHRAHMETHKTINRISRNYILHLCHRKPFCMNTVNKY